MNARLYSLESEKTGKDSKVANDKICHVTGAIFLPYCIESRLIILNNVKKTKTKKHVVQCSLEIYSLPFSFLKWRTSPYSTTL